MDFVAIDFETAACETNSACALGIATVENLQVVNSEYYLIQPPTLLFAKKNIEIHGILPEHVKDKPKFPEVWESIKHYFDGSCPVFAHNARFDMSVLMQSLKYYEIEIPAFIYACSIPFSAPFCVGVPKSLEARAEYFGIELINHHNAEADAITCAEIVNYTVKSSRWKTFNSYCNVHNIDFREFEYLNPQKSLGNTTFEQIDYKHAIASEPTCESVFKDKVVVITGLFAKYSRKELAQVLLNMGAIVKDSVTKQTNYLIVGTQDNSIVGEDGLSGKQEKAYALRDKGFDITILDELQIYGIISEYKDTLPLPI